jgi:transcriptional regulator with XRE-family HTH domain
VAGISDKGWDLGGYLREQREHARLSVRQLATLAGVSNPYLSQVERGLRKPSAEVLQQIARGLRISAEALYVRAGILDSEGRPDVEAAVNADPDLNDRQRRVLLDIYASFRAENRRATETEPEPEPEPKRRPVARVRSAATSARTATRSATGRAVRSAAKQAAGATPEPAGTTPEPEPAQVPAPRERATARATKRATKRATSTSTKAAQEATAAPSDALSTSDAAPGEHP